MQLLEDGGVLGVDSADNRGQEEGQTLDSNVVQEEDEGSGENGRVEDTAKGLLLVQLVEHTVLADTLRLDTGNGQVLLCLGQPAGRLWSVGQGEEGDDGDDAGDDAFNREDHPPSLQRTERFQIEDG